MAKTKPADGRRSPIARGAFVFSVVAPATYVALRLYEIARTGHVDPSLILRSTHVGYLWRIAIATWWGLTCAFIAHRLPAKAATPSLGALTAAVFAFVTLAAFAYP